ncbi:MAG: hypothetical protein CMJ59_16450 [Planctomycetaceae bacterium]|nr:hypothetical protein [Planctomycetaceae bacterium]
MTGLFLTDDLMFASRVGAQAESLGLTIQTVNSVETLGEALACEPLLFVIDLAAVATDQLATTIAAVRQRVPGATVIAFGPHVWEAKLKAADQAGCDQVFTRGQFHNEMAALLQQHLAG